MRPFLPIVALSLLLCGCLSPAGAEPRHPDSLAWGVVGVPDVSTLDPALASDPTSISVASLIYGGLVRLDGKLRVRPDGARSWSISPNGRVYTFHLRPNLRFPDGRSVTAQNFAASLQRALGPEGSSGTAPFYLNLIAHGSSPAAGVQAVNRSTLRITLVHPAAHFLTELAFPASYVPDPAVMQRYGSNWTDHAAGFGPYYVQTWRHSRFLTLVRNPHYYGGAPRLRRITIRFYGGLQSATAAYRAGAVDVVSGLQPGSNPPTHLSGVRRVPALALDYLAFDATRLPFSRLAARRAFASTASAGVVSRVMGARAFPADGFLPSAFGIKTASWQPKRSPATYLARAHFPLGQGFPPVTLVLPHDPSLHAVAVALQSTWRHRLNLSVRIRSLNSQNYSEALDARAFDLALVRWGADYPDPQDFLGTQIGDTSDNVTGWGGTKFDDDVLRADSYSPSDPRREQIYRAAANLAALHVPLRPLDEPALCAIIRPGLTGITLTAMDTVSGEWARAHFS